MFSHVTVGTNDFARAAPFWSAVMAALGHGELMRSVDGAAFDGNAAAPGNGVHVAFITRDRATVDAFHAAALANGGTDEGAPGPRPHYHANYYGAYVRDPDGNKLQAVCHRAPT